MKARKALTIRERGTSIQKPLLEVLSLETLLANITKTIRTVRQNKSDLFQQGLEKLELDYQASKPPPNRILPASPALIDLFKK